MFTSKMTKFLLSSTALSLTVALSVAQAAPEGAAPGTEAREWLHGDPTPDLKAPEFNVEKSQVTITMADGTKLDAQLFRPILKEGAEKPACILVPNGYGVESGLGARMDLSLFDAASRGFSGLQVSLRGSGKSEGKSELYSSYAEDTAAVIDWMGEQDWCNGNVGTMGTSMLGITQWLTMKQMPKGLKAISPWIGSADPYSYLWYPGGMLPGPSRAARPQWEYGVATEHRDKDEWWSERTISPAEMEKAAAAGVAVLMSGGYHDYVTAGQIMVWDQYSSPSGAQKQMILGPFDHSTNGKPYYIFERELEFFDRYLRGNANAIDERPAVTVFIEGPNRWRYEKDWPLPDETRVKLALNPKASETVAGFKSGSLGGELAAEAEGLKIDYDPEKGPFLHALLSTTGRLKSDRAANEAENVSWTSAPLSQAVELTGRASITLSVNPEGEEADLVAQLSAVAPDGSSKQLANGYLNLARAEDASKPAKLENGSFKPYTLHLWPMAVVVPEGHALRVTLSGGASPAPDQPAPQGPGKGLKPFSVTIGQSSAQPAVVELPIIGSVPPELK